MSVFSENHSLKDRNTFGFEVSCRYFLEADSEEVLQNFFKQELHTSLPYMFIGEGSNILFTGDFAGTIIHPLLRGVEILSEDKENIRVRVYAGENWDSFVAHCVKNKWYGLENLSLIPGSCGSSPVQNIGAYGVEVKDRITEVSGIYAETGEKAVFQNSDCRFGYRSSIFKTRLKNRFLITSVDFLLDKIPKFELGYGPVEKEFRSRPVQNLQSLRDTIISIRESKLPDPSKLGNAGSFFKNPVIPEEQFISLKNTNPGISFFPAEKGFIKIPAAWLIEHSGWKGVREGNTGTWPLQPLVIINYGGATGREIRDFAGRIVESVFQKFGVRLEMEVNVV
jgi:UDP-N-acetylmuramate dehydrogenase